MIELRSDPRAYVMPGIQALLGGGWRLSRIPERGRLPANQVLLTLRTGSAERRYRLLVYAVSTSSRGRPDERRVEITTTYLGSLKPASNVQDVVLGWERDEAVYVGIDSRRLHAGGTTHNASTFVSLAGIREATGASQVLVLPHLTNLLGVEQVAYFAPDVLDEYLLNIDDIHGGAYKQKLRRPSRAAAASRSVADDAAAGEVLVLTRRGGRPAAVAPRARDVEHVEAGWRKRRGAVTPEGFERVLERAAENGRLGEAHVFAAEQTRLARARRRDLAEQVRWVGRESVSEGFDILSYESTGDERFIEVKSTQGTARRFPITLNEWAVADVRREKYLIARVTNVRDKPDIRWLRNPVALHAAGELQRDADGWRITYE